jgi:putative spermidine/putrescine transport system permease protein
MRSSGVAERSGWGLRAAVFGGLAFLHVPLLFVILYAFTTESKTYAFPPPGLTLEWFERAWNRPDIWQALGLSVQVAAIATAFALVFGETISLLIILPIALPGIITGISLRAAIGLADIPFSFWTIVIGHGTFCIVVVYNNVVARMRRASKSMLEASADLGAHSFQTLRHVVLPQIATALLAGGMLAFALSFDEIIVTTFTAGQQQTLPIWMLEELIRPRERPVTNVVAIFVIGLTLIPILAAYYLTRDTDSVAGSGK